MTIHRGGCHCGKVRFELEAPSALEVLECNCSLCQKVGFMHLLVPRSDFRLVSGKDSLTSYQFNTRTANHLFCKVCGVKSFYVPRSHPNDFSVNARCLDEGTVQMMTVTPFDGQNWESAAEELEPLSGS
jgi:hypothetical protein